MTGESATSLEVVVTLVVYCPWGWVVGRACFGTECTTGQAGLKSIFISFKLYCKM